MKNLAVTFFAVISLIFSANVFAKLEKHKVENIEGVWQTFDDKTGHRKAHIKISYNKKTDSYVGRIIKITPAPGYTPQKYCDNCPKPFTGKPVKGMALIWNLKPQFKSNGKFTGQYDKGYLVDPNNGKTYRFKAAVSRNQKILKVRGYIGMALMGRSQTWTRVK